MSIRLLLCISPLVLASCNNAVYKSRTAKSTEINGPGIIQLPVVADLNVRPAKASFTVDDKRKSLNLRQLKEAAIAGALQEQKADVLVEPTFSIDSRRGMNTVTVTGWPADYARFRNMDTTDIRLVEAGSLYKAQTNTTLADVDKPRKRKGGMLAVVITGVIVLLTLSLSDL
ncbi:MAG: hypothetical protein RLZZ630_974 [Bacteroidota bacterium]